MPYETTLSVRGEARYTVAPDVVTVRGALRVAATDRAAALEDLRRGQDGLIDALERLGGTRLTPESHRGELTWTFGSLSVREERDLDETTGRRTATGAVAAWVAVLVTTRRLVLLPQVAAALAELPGAQVHDIAWSVDADNPAWRTVRTDAIEAALAKARDYAAALGGTVTRIEHVADTGMLAADGPRRAGTFTRTSGLGAASLPGDEHGIPDLDPVPQEIAAEIEARVTATVDGPVGRSDDRRPPAADQESKTVA